MEELENKYFNILVAAGGTGGHLFPAIAVVEQLEKLTNHKINIFFIGSENRIESVKVPELGYKYYSMPITGFTGFSLKSLFYPFKVMNSVYKARAIIKTHQIDAVIATGAYISFPPGNAAANMKKPLFLMESNVNPGKAIAHLADDATMIFTSFDDSYKYFDEGNWEKIRAYGNPVRNFILDLPPRDASIDLFGMDKSKKTVLVVGGSLGAMSINRAVENEIEKLAAENYQVLWQTGKNYTAPLHLPDNIYAHQFIDNMAAALSVADIVVSRSGATSVAEICVTGKPSILIPMPSASNNEQFHNAKLLSDNDAGILVPDNEIQGQMYNLIDSLMKDSDKAEKMGANAARLGKADAGERIATAILNFLEDRKKNEEERIKRNLN